MEKKQRFAIGGLGALMPVLVSLLAVDVAAIIDDGNELTTGNVIGVFVRYIILFFIGGFVAYLHEDESKPFKLFEIGIAAPALITSLITAQGIAPSKPQDNEQSSFSFFVSSAYAGTMESHQENTVIAGFFSDLSKGITGKIYEERAIRKINKEDRRTPSRETQVIVVPENNKESISVISKGVEAADSKAEAAKAKANVAKLKAEAAQDKADALQKEYQVALDQAVAAEAVAKEKQLILESHDVVLDKP